MSRQEQRTWPEHDICERLLRLGIELLLAWLLVTLKDTAVSRRVQTRLVQSHGVEISLGD